MQLEAYIDKRVDTRMDAKLDAVFNRHLDDLRGLVVSGFPNDNPSSHREWHEEQIALMKSRRVFYENIRNKTSAGLVWAALVGIGGLVLAGIKTLLHAN